MAPHDNRYWQYLQQQQHSQPGNPHTQNAYSQSSGQPTYSAWHHPSNQPSSATESRAAETLSALSNQAAAYKYQQGADNAAAHSQTTSWSQSRQMQLPNPVTTTSLQSPPAYANMGSNIHTTHQAFGSHRNQSTNAQSRQYQSHGDSSSTSSQQNYGQHRNSFDYNSTSAQSPTQPNHGMFDQTQNFSGQQFRAHDYSAVRSTPHQESPSDMGGHSRKQTLTPSIVQQQAHNQTHASSGIGHAVTHITVDPSQVYDPYSERQRQAEKAAQERRRRELEEAERAAAEEQRKKALAEAEERRKAAETAERLKEEQEKARLASEAKRKLTSQNKGGTNSQKRKKTTSATQEQGGQGPDGLKEAQQLAADAIANATTTGNSNEAQMEAEMRALFQKMRQYNQANPQMLAKLWEEERVAHTSESATPPVVDSQPATTNPPSANVKKPRQRKSNAAAVISPGSQSTLKFATKATAEQQVPASAAEPPSATDATQATTKVATSRQPPPTTTVWPPGRKKMVGEVGAKWLNAHKKNAGKHMEPAKFAELLQGNPSYATLCQQIEQMGFYLDRSSFAANLLREIPDLARPSPAAGKPDVPASPDQSTSVNSTAIAPSLSAAASAQVVPIEVAAPAVVRPSIEPRASPQINANRAQGAFRSQSPVTSLLGQGAIGRNPSGMNSQPRTISKEQAARKRNFSELVSLLSDDSDQDDFPTAKATKLHGDGASLSADPSGLTSLPSNAAPQFSNPTDPGRPLQQKMRPNDARLKGMILVNPIERRKVLRRSVYDPRTIARDVLLATGRHPEMRALNGHLIGMQNLLSDHSKGVDSHKYDLATIRWDLIDPGIPIESEEEESESAASEADDESDQIPLKASATNPSIPATDSTEVQVNAPSSLRNGLEKPKRGRPRGFKVLPSQPHTPTPTAPHFTRPSPSASSIQPAQAAMNNSVHHAQSLAGPSDRSGTPSGSTPVGYAAFRSQAVTLDENGMPVKKKGRPVGWRKAIHSKEAQGLSPTTKPAARMTGNDQIKRRGRPPKHAVSVQEPRRPDPQYSVWRCQWEGCHAELHNLDTLRKHIVRIHGVSVNNLFRCHWASCSVGGQGLDAPLWAKSKQLPPSSRHTFPEISSWVAHMEDAHLRSLARLLGDGPRSGLSEAYDSEASQAAYLSDAMSGCLVTPRATPLPEVPEGWHMDDAEQASPLAAVLRRGMPRVRGILSDEQREDEYKLSQLEAKKLSLGPMFDRGGVDLASEKRRIGFYDDDDFEGEFSADDGPISEVEEDKP